jgi:hypothetical protein
MNVKKIKTPTLTLPQKGRECGSLSLWERAGERVRIIF